MGLFQEAVFSGKNSLKMGVLKKQAAFGPGSPDRLIK